MRNASADGGPRGATARLGGDHETWPSNPAATSRHCSPLLNGCIPKVAGETAGDTSCSRCCCGGRLSITKLVERLRRARTTAGSSVPLQGVPGEKGSSSMIRSMRSRAIRVITLPMALTLALGLSTQAQATPSQVCGNGGSGYCLNDWGGGGHSGDVIKMFNGGTTNDDFFVQKVNRCSGRDTVEATLRGSPINCPFGNTSLDVDFFGKTIVQIVYTNNESQCVGATGATATLESCAQPITGAGGGNGVIQVMYSTTCNGIGGTVFLNRALSDVNGDSWLVSGGNPGVAADYEGFEGTCWGGFQLFNP